MSSTFSDSSKVKGKMLDVQFHIARAAVLSHNILLATETKPGGASFNKSFVDTSPIDFLSGGSGLFAPMFELSKRGILVAQNHLWYEDAEIGFFIKKGLKNAQEIYRSKGNTILGTILMYAPLAVSIANFYANEGMKTTVPLNLDMITKVTEHFLKQSSRNDCTNLTEVLVNNVSENILPSDKEEDDFNSFLRIYQYENTNLYELTKFYEDRDLIFHELANRYEITVESGYNFFKRIYDETKDITLTTSQTFLNILATKTDTHIAKRFGNEIAKEVKSKAQKIMEKGGILSEEGKQYTDELAHYLRNSQSRIINPGTTADLTSTTLFLALLDGYKS